MKKSDIKIGSVVFLSPIVNGKIQKKGYYEVFDIRKNGDYHLKSMSSSNFNVITSNSDFLEVKTMEEFYKAQIQEYKSIEKKYQILKASHCQALQELIHVTNELNALKRPSLN